MGILSANNSRCSLAIFPQGYLPKCITNFQIRNQLKLWIYKFNPLYKWNLIYIKCFLSELTCISPIFWPCFYVKVSTIRLMSMFIIFFFFFFFFRSAFNFIIFWYQNSNFSLEDHKKFCSFITIIEYRFSFFNKSILCLLEEFPVKVFR